LQAARSILSRGSPEAGEAILDVRDLTVALQTDDRAIHPVDGISFRLERGRTLAVVGESGSGKSMTALAIVGLLPRGLAHLTGGQVLLAGEDLAGIPESELRRRRGSNISLMPQDPMTALNPSLTIGYQVMEPLMVHERLPRSLIRIRAIELLKRTGIGNLPDILDAYPHQLSGGMRQRVVLAMALICRPGVLVADEPTTALDVTTQEQIIDLLQDLQREFGLSLIVISHDLGVVARIADHVLVMYAGRPAEYGSVDDIFARPSHPYTRGLLNSVDFASYPPRERLRSIPGVPPRLEALPSGCAFHPRCAYARDICRELKPTLMTAPGFPSLTACHVAQAGDLEPWPSPIGR